MDCRHFGEKLCEYESGALPPQELAGFEAHLQQCARCAGQLATVRGLDELLGQAQQTQPSRDLWADIAPRLRQRRRGPVSWAARRWRPLALATSLGAAAAVAIVLALPMRPQATPPPQDVMLLADGDVTVQWQQPMADEAALGLHMLLDESPAGDHIQ